jgi:hypothetical protein
MPGLSYVHQLCHAAQCPASIPTLRGQDRPLQGPRWQSHHIGPGGASHYQPGRHRSRWQAQAGQRPVHARTGTRVADSQRSLLYWILATFLLGLACASRRLAREWGGPGRPGYRWWWWLRHAAARRARKGEFVKYLDHFDLLRTARN